MLKFAVLHVIIRLNPYWENVDFLSRNFRVIGFQDFGNPIGIAKANGGVANKRQIDYLIWKIQLRNRFKYQYLEAGKVLSKRAKETASGYFDAISLRVTDLGTSLNTTLKRKSKLSLIIKKCLIKLTDFVVNWQLLTWHSVQHMVHQHAASHVDQFYSLISQLLLLLLQW